MPDPGVSLIPRGSKSTKKRRTSFRPASKKSNQNKNKTANASKASKAKAALPNKAQEQQVSTTDASKVSSLVDSAQTTAKSSAENEAGRPLSSTAESSASLTTNERSRSGEDTIARAKAASLTKEPMSPRTTRSSSAANGSSPARTTSPRKRKAHSLNNKISIGSSLRRIPEVSNEDALSSSDSRKNETADVTGIIESSKPEKSKDGEGKENVALEAKKHAFTTASVQSNTPAFSGHDQAILNQLAKEENETQGMTLNSFCTKFKGKKRKLENDKEGAKQNPSSKNKGKDGGGDASDSAKGASNDSSNDAAAADSKNKNKKVDATTNGAPSVQIIDGQIVLQESSVMLPARRTIQEVEEEFHDNVVEEDEQLNIVQASYTSFVTKGDHGKTRKKGSWTIEETEKFYFALQQLGTDFGSMEALFFEDQRTRKQLKNKYRKELAKNPGLVQELALNPKYQIQLDMTALNLNVDPKRIEAHENEEPPAYEPTDVIENEIETENEETASTEKSDKPESENDYNGVFEKEVVEEDAEEERLAEARARQEQNKKATSRPSAEHRKKKEKGNFPSEFGEGPGADFQRGSEEGPNMDDFFGDSYGDDAREAAAEKDNASSLPSQKAAANKTKTSEMVSLLVPKKTIPKSRRPIVRPSRRKRNENRDDKGKRKKKVGGKGH